jgi:multicomponent Na+:H+ antiporter subunit A
MQAPAPVSAYLHSATMVKAGVFLLARLSPVLGGTAEWTFIIPLIGVLTMLTGSYFAITKTDLKAILAYTTINALGILVLLIGIDTKLSVKAAVLFLFIHAFYKASLFMIAGFIEKKTGTRDIKNWRMFVRFPSLCGYLAGLVVDGCLPPMLGFWERRFLKPRYSRPDIGSLIFFLG